MPKSTGQRAAKKQAWRQLVADHFDALVKLVEAGIPLAHACLRIVGGPNQNAVRRYVRIYPQSAASLRAARMRAGGTSRWSSIPASAWDAALELVASTDEKRLTNLRQPGIPHLDELRRRARRDPAFSVRLDAALQRHAERFGPRRHDRASFLQAIAVMRANPSANLVDLSAMLRGIHLPPLGAIYSARRRDEAIGREYAAMSAARGVRRYDEEAHARARHLLATDPLNARRILNGDSTLPSFGAMRSRAFSDDETARVYEESRQARRLRRAKQAHERATRRAERALPAEQLRTGLLMNEIYRQADGLFSKGLPADVRDDLISEVVIAVLDGELAEDEIADYGAAIGWRAVSNRRVASLDQPLFDDADVTALDRLTSDEWSAEGSI